jgi:hypothetical protein
MRKLKNTPHAALLLVILFTLAPSPVSAGVVLVSWNRNIEPDLAGYRVYCGTSPGTYTHVLTVGNKTRVFLNGIQEGTYYIAVTAYDSSGNESEFSSEVKADVSPGILSFLEPLLELGLSALDVLYEFSSYATDTGMVLEDSITGISLEIPPFAAPGSLLVGLGSSGVAPGPWASQLAHEAPPLEFDIVPNGYLLRRPALVHVPFTGDRAVVSRYENGAWIPLDVFQSDAGMVSFTTSVLGRFKVSSVPPAVPDDGTRQEYRPARMSAPAQDNTDEHSGPRDDHPSPPNGNAPEGMCFLSTPGTGGSARTHCSAIILCCMLLSCMAVLRRISH